MKFLLLKVQRIHFYQINLPKRFQILSTWFNLMSQTPSYYRLLSLIIIATQCIFSWYTYFRRLGSVRYISSDVRIRRPVFRYECTIFPRCHTSSSIQPSLLLRSFRFLINPEELRCFASNIAAKFEKILVPIKFTYMF